MCRLEKLKDLLPGGSDGLLVSSQKNIRYLTGFNFTDGYALVTRKKSYILADFRYIEAARAAAGGGWEAVMLSGKRSELIGGLLAQNGVKALGYEDNTVTCAGYNALKKDFPDINFVPVGSLIEDIREFKDTDEIKHIIEAQRIAELAFDYILGFITPSRSETEIALELEYFMRKNGASSVSFDIIAVSGRASALPHGEPRERRLEQGFLTLDFGAVYRGYCSDMTRTVSIGRADDAMKHVYATVLEAQKAALDMAAPGVKCFDIDKRARDIIDNAGYGGCFGHGLGHGVGMNIHEAPGLSPGSGDKTLKPGHVVTVEPGIYLEGKYGVRIEDMLIIEPAGARNITRAPKQLIEIL
ncbi:MAG: aminopeptidase P family protein [Eubacteriales bacterium]|nr:aminopeptidase P family protein [Eubacteriales bacterium]